MQEDEVHRGRQTKSRARLMVDVSPAFQETVLKSAADQGLSMRDFVTQALHLTMLVDRMVTRGWVLDIKDREGNQIITDMPAFLLPELGRMDERVLDLFIKQRLSLGNPARD